MNAGDIGEFLGMLLGCVFMAASAALGVKIGSPWIGAQPLNYRAAWRLALRTIGVWSVVLGVVFHFARVPMDSGQPVNGTVIGLAVGLIHLSIQAASEVQRQQKPLGLGGGAVLGGLAGCGVLVFMMLPIVVFILIAMA
jgi:hypothetical protein